MLDLGQFILLCTVAGLVGLDATATLQVMLSRPLVVGGLMGWLLGDLALGMTVGGLIELLWVGGLPVGSLVPPDSTVAAGLAAVIAVHLRGASADPGASAAAISLGVLLAVPAGFLGARAEIIQRRLMGRLGRQALTRADEGRLQSLGRYIALAIAMAWLRGTLAMALCLALLLPLAQWLLQHLPINAIRALHWSFWLFWLLGLAVVADHFWDRRGLKYAALLLLGLALVGARPNVGQWQILFALLVCALGLGLGRWFLARRETAPA